MPADIQIFECNDFGELRIFTAGDDLWFAAADVAKALDYRDANSVTRHLDDDEIAWSGDVPLIQGEFPTPNLMRKNGLRIISEAGFYHITLVSNSKKAAPFRRWVTHEVIPAIRRSGGYMVAKEDESASDLMARALLVAQETLERRERKIADLTAKNTKLSGKADFYDKVMSQDGMIPVTDAAKLLMSGGCPIRPKHLTALLREDGMLEKRTRKATAKAIERGYMRERMFTIRHSDGHEEISHYGCLTAKGLDWCRARYGLQFQTQIDYKEESDG